MSTTNLTINPPEYSGMYETGDLIVGSYREDGSKISNGQLYGNTEEISKLTKKIISAGINSGAVVSSQPLSKPVRGKNKVKNETKTPEKPKSQPKTLSEKQAAVDEIYTTHINNLQNKSLPIIHYTTNNANSASPLHTFAVICVNAFGKIKIKVIDYLEDDLSVILVFENEEAITFEPKIGEYLSLSKNKDHSQHVMYTGFKHTWIDNTKRLLVFIKSEESEK